MDVKSFMPESTYNRITNACTITAAVALLNNGRLGDVGALTIAGVATAISVGVYIRYRCSLARIADSETPSERGDNFGSGDEAAVAGSASSNQQHVFVRNVFFFYPFNQDALSWYPPAPLRKRQGLVEYIEAWNGAAVQAKVKRPHKQKPRTKSDIPNVFPIAAYRRPTSKSRMSVSRVVRDQRGRQRSSLANTG